MKYLFSLLFFLSFMFAEDTFDLFDFPNIKTFEGSLQKPNKEEIAAIPFKESQDLKIFKYKDKILLFSKGNLSSVIEFPELKELSDIDKYVNGFTFQNSMILEYLQNFNNKTSNTFVDKIMGRQSFSEKLFTDKSLKTQAIIYLTEHYNKDNKNIIITFGKGLSKDSKDCVQCEYIESSKVKEEGSSMIIYSIKN